MLIRVLGSVQIDVGDDGVDVGPPQRCVVLAALATDAGRLVTHETLVDRVWGSAPPLRALRTAQTHVANLRSLLTRIDSSARATVTVRRRGGYVLDLAPDLVDVHRLRRLAAEASDAALLGMDRLALLREAVGLWRGEPLAGLAGEWIERTRQAWYDEYREVVISWALAEIDAGRPVAVLSRLDALIVRYPLVESLPAVLMRALYAAGRRTEALNCYAAIRQRLDEELAERPGPQLRAVYQAILRREPTPPLTQLAAPAETGVLVAAAVPRQLPVDVRGFAGRAEQLIRLDALAATLGGGVDEGATVVISAIAGTAGVGKTALAVHWAHRVADRFPDGQLYVNLRGFDPGGRRWHPAEALRGFLDALGVPPQRIPADLDAQAGAVPQPAGRTADAGRAGQRPRRRPGPPAAARRARLPGPGHQPQPAHRPGRRRRRPPARRWTCSPPARPASCWPAASARAGSPPSPTRSTRSSPAAPGCRWRWPSSPPAPPPSPSCPLAALAAELRDTAHAASTRWPRDDPATDVRAVFSWSYQAAAARPRPRLFRLLGLHPGPDISPPAAASLAGLTRSPGAAAAGRADRAHLITEHAPGRYTFHDLLRAYAAELAHDHRHRRSSATPRPAGCSTTTCTPPTPPPGCWTRPATRSPLAPPAAGVTPEQPRRPRAGAGLVHRRASGAARRRRPRRRHRLRHPHLAAGLDPARLPRPARALARPGRRRAGRGGRRPAAGRPDRAGPRPPQPRRRLHPAGPPRRRAHPAAPRPRPATPQPATRPGRPTPTSASATLWERQGQPRARPCTTPGRPSTCTRPPATGTGRPTPSTRSAGTTPCSATTSRPSPTASRPSPCTRSSATATGRPAPGTASATPTTTSATTPRPSPATSTPSTCSGTSATATTRPTILTHLGDTHHAAGDPDAARDAWQQALTILDDLDHPDAAQVRAKLADVDPPTDRLAP